MKKHLIFFSVVTFIIGGLGGYSTGYFQGIQASFPRIIPVQEKNPGVATIKLMEVNDGNLVGRVDGQKARLAYNSEQILELAPGDNFELPLNEVALNLFYLENQIPEDIHFIASSSGKYYYPVLDKRSLNIAPKNRVFFHTAEEAEKDGYLFRE